MTNTLKEWRALNVDQLDFIDLDYAGACRIQTTKSKGHW